MSVSINIEGNQRTWYSILTYLITRVVALVLLANGVYIGSAHIAPDSGGIAIVAVDASQNAPFDSSNPRNSDMALIHLIAISARAIKLSKIVRGEPLDVDGTGAIVLNDLVLGALGTTSDNIERARSRLQGQCVY